MANGTDGLLAVVRMLRDEGLLDRCTEIEFNDAGACKVGLVPARQSPQQVEAVNSVKTDQRKSITDALNSAFPGAYIPKF